MTRAVLSLGSNLGDRLGNLRGAVTSLAGRVRVMSGTYESPPWRHGDDGDDDQPAYLNAAVIVADDRVDALGWLHQAQELERAAGRARDPHRRYAPRTLDVDVIAVWTADGKPVERTDDELTLPHPRAHLRAFVLRPWIDIEPYAILPGHGRLSDLLAAASLADQVSALVARPDLRLEPPA